MATVDYSLSTTLPGVFAKKVVAELQGKPSALQELSDYGIDVERLPERARLQQDKWGVVAFLAEKHGLIERAQQLRELNAMNAEAKGARPMYLAAQAIRALILIHQVPPEQLEQTLGDDYPQWLESRRVPVEALEKVIPLLREYGFTEEAGYLEEWTDMENPDALSPIALVIRNLVAREGRHHVIQLFGFSRSDHNPMATRWARGEELPPGEFDDIRANLESCDLTATERNLLAHTVQAETPGTALKTITVDVSTTQDPDGPEFNGR